MRGASYSDSGFEQEYLQKPVTRTAKLETRLGHLIPFGQNLLQIPFDQP